MSSCTIPVLHRPGYLRVDYQHTTQGINHGCRVGLIDGIDPLDVGLMQGTADDMADAMHRVMTAAFTLTGYTVMAPDGHVLYAGSLTAPFVGSHAAAGGALDYASRTVTFTGHAIPALGGGCSGETRAVLFVGAAFEYIPRQRSIAAGADVGCDFFRDFLVGSTVVWADYYGQKAVTRGKYPIQFNGYQQKRNGT